MRSANPSIAVIAGMSVTLLRGRTVSRAHKRVKQKHNTHKRELRQDQGKTAVTVVHGEKRKKYVEVCLCV